MVAFWLHGHGVDYAVFKHKGRVIWVAQDGA